MYKQAYYRGGAVMNKTKLQWEKLFSEDRERKTKLSYEIRNAFECDYDRIVGSSSVRRLQDKAQVFPLQENDFTRTRLTHSIEVSAIARSLGKQVGRELEKGHKFEREDTEKLEALLQTTGLVHDLGNPPFGHYGEKAIGKWFEKYFIEKGLKKEQKQEEKPLRILNLHHWLRLKKEKKQKEKPEIDITKEQMREFEHFDGNVQNIRILTKLQAMNDRYGANFTYATLAGIIKYPWAANDEKKRYGYYESEEKIIENMYNATGLEKGIRHPAVYLMEAADDITYIGDDIEDGVKKGYIDIDTEYERLKKRYESQQKNFFISCDKYFGQINEKMSKNDQLNAKARYFRNTIQGYLINKAKEEFLNKYECIMSGDYGNVALLERDSNMKSFIGKLKDITGRNCFGCREVLALELAGHKVITGLLDILVPAVLRKDCNYEDTKQYEGKIANIISSNYIYIAKQDYNYESKDDPMDEKTRKWEELSDYEKIHLVVDFVSGMTDSYAMNLYQELMGIKLPYQ